MNDDDDDEPCRLVVVICLHLYPRQPNNPPPRLQLRDRVGFYHHFFLSQRTPTTTTSHVGSSLSSASIVDLQRVITTRWGFSLPLHLRHQPHRPPSLVVAPVFSCIGVI